MDKEQSKTNKFRELRLKAEEKLENTFNEQGKVPDQDDLLSIKELIHELQVHQSELEMQNDELQNTKEKLKQSEKRYEDLYNSIPVSYLTLNKYGNILDCNATAIQKLNTNRGYLINKSFYDFISTQDKDKLYLHLIEVLKKSGQDQCELQIHLIPDHSNENAAITENPVEPFTVLLDSKVFTDKDGKAICRTVLNNITDRKEMEHELKTAKEKAEENDVLKSAFLANLSHEIRSPMNGILGFTDWLIRAEISSEEKDQYIDMIHKSGKRLMNTVDDIIAISKIETGTLKLESRETDLNKKLSELTQFFRPEAEKKGLQLQLDYSLPPENTMILTDEGKLESILTNLIKNAIKYTDEGRIHLGCRKRASTIEFYVSDSGIGIPDDRIDGIFNRFEQADISDKRAFEGSGLGLSIVKSYAQMLGGNVRVTSEEGKGSTFYITLPYKPADLTEKASPENETSLTSSHYDLEAIRHQNLNILVAEDDDASFLVVKALLKNLNCQITHTKSGTETIETCYQNPDFDLILMDIKMPEMNGYEASRKIREFNNEVYIIAQTAYAMKGAKEQSLKAGINDYIAKPIRFDSMMEAIYLGICAR